MQSVTTTYPIVTAAQNGPGTADSEVVFFDTFSRPTYSKDADGYINKIEYDPATSAVTKTIAIPSRH